MASPYDHVIFTDVDGADGVLVDLNTKQYYQLNETASLVWRGLAGGTPADAIAQQLTEAYDVTLEHATASMDAVIQNFIAYRLVKPSPQA